MVKKINHKIFNLIIMIVLSIVILTISNSCYAIEKLDITENSILLADADSDGDYQILAPVEADYQPEADEENDELDGALFRTVNDSSFTKIMKENVAQWYFIFRYASIAIMLVLLIVLAIKLGISSVAADKALYKRMIVDWVVCFILLYFIHYFMIFVLYINESIISIIKKVSVAVSTNGEITLYETVRSRAFDLNFLTGFTGMILYMNLVWFTCKFVYIYAKRFITIMILTIIAPIMVLFYSLKKVLTGSSKVLTKWMEEYAMNVLLQTIHALLYAVFVGISLELTDSSIVGIILSILVLNFMSKADKIFRNIFKFSDGSESANENADSKMSDLIDTAKDAALFGAAVKQSHIGAAVKSATGAVARTAARPGIRAASALGLGNALDKFNEWSDKRIEAKNENFDISIKESDEQLQTLTQTFKNNKDTMTEEQKTEFRKKIIEAGEENVKRKRKKSSYNTRRNAFRRLRNTIDPDTYMEYVRDSEGNIKKNIFGKDKRRVVKTRKVFNPETGKTEVVQSLSTVFKENKDAILGFSEEDKALLKEAKDMIRNGTLGAMGVVIGMGAIADNPALGMGLLAAGSKSLRKISSTKKKGLNVSLSAKLAMRKAAKKEREEYTFKAFSSKALLNIDNIIRELAQTDPDVGRFDYLISQMQNGGYKLATLPFTLTGTKGILINIFDWQKRVADQAKNDIAEYEREVSLEVMKSLTGEVTEQFDKVYENIEKHIDETDIYELVEERLITNHSIFTVEDEAGNKVRFKFGEDVYAEGATDEACFGNALINTAKELNVYDLNKLNLKNKKTLELFKEKLKEEGVVSDDILSSSDMMHELIYGKQGSKGINDLRKKMARENPEVVKNRLYRETVRNYMESNKITSMKDIERGQHKQAIKHIFESRIATNSAISHLDTLLVSMANNNGTYNVKNMNIDDILSLAPSNSDQVELFKQAIEAASEYNQENLQIYKKLNAAVQGQALGDLDGFKAEIENRQKELDQKINDIVISALANNDIGDINLLSASPNDPKVIAFQNDVMNLLKFAGINNSNEELKQIVEEKVNEISSQDIESAMIKDEMQKFIDERFDGDVEAFKNALNTDSSLQEEFETKVLERLKGANKDTSRESEIDDILSMMKKGKVSQETINKSQEYAQNDSFIQEDEAIEVPYPDVKTKVLSNSITYIFSVPNDPKADGCTVEVCKIDKDDHKGKWISATVMDLMSEEKLIARLTKNGKHGPALILKYPKPITDVVSQIDENRKNNIDPEEIDRIEANSMKGMSEYDTSQPLEERLGSQLSDTINSDPNIESLFRERAKTAAVNNINTVMDSILDYRKRLKPDDEEFEEIFDDSVGILDDMVGKTSDQRDDYENNANKLLDLLLQQKYISDDANAIKISKNKKVNKEYKKAIQNEREYTSKGIADADFDRLIASLNH